jgi:GAF domain-containing protein
VTREPRPPAGDPAGFGITGALREARSELAMDVAVLAEIERDHWVVRQLAGDGESFGLRIGVSTPLEETYCQRLLDGRLTSIVHDAGNDERVRDLERTRVARIGAYIGVPLTGLQARLYVLCCLAHEQRQSLSERDVAFLRALGTKITSELAARGSSGGPARAGSPRAAEG